MKETYITAKKIVLKAEKDIKSTFEYYEEVALNNQEKVLNAFINNHVTDSHLNGSTGYGYNDMARDTLDEIYADIFKAEKAIVRGQFVSGTHAISAALNGLLFPGDEIIFATGTPYDTLHKIIGWTSDSPHTLINKGISCKVIDLLNDSIDLDALKKNISAKTKVIHFQKSRGYTNRDTFSNENLEEAFKIIKNIDEEIIIFVDNCYGEFVEKTEPIEHGADIIAGSLIKNPGGGLALWGGYIAGKQKLINNVLDYAVAPGLGEDMGGTYNIIRSFYQGIFLAPSVVKNSTMGAILMSKVMEDLGFMVSPIPNEKRYDIIQTITFNDEDILLEFCKGIQNNSPIDSIATPVPSLLPGYDVPVVMAAGAFVQGASIELSADAPIKKPYTVFMQGGLTYEHVKIAIIKIVEVFLKKGYFKELLD